MSSHYLHIKSTSGKVSVYLIVLIIGVVLGAIIGGETIRRIYERKTVAQPSDTTTAPQAQAPTSKESTNDDAQFTRNNAIVKATHKVASCVVGIVVTQVQVVRNPYYAGDFFDLFFAPELIPREVENMGSGFLISSEGLILTNFHVVDGAQKLVVTMPGKEFEGKIIGVDPQSDLALVKIEGTKFPFVKLGDSDSSQIGEWVIAIGNPFGYFINDAHPTVTVGVISAVQRNFAPSEGTVYQSMIQTDAAINPGNSGGPLANAAGEVIGINTFIFTGNKQSKGSIGIGFAIPINRAKNVVSELSAYGKRRPVWTGIAVRDLDRSTALAMGYERVNGVIITNIARSSPGDNANLAAGDIIIRLGGNRIYASKDIEGVFVNYFAGDKLPIEYLRKGQRITTTMILREYPQR